MSPQNSVSRTTRWRGRSRRFLPHWPSGAPSRLKLRLRGALDHLTQKRGAALRIRAAERDEEWRRRARRRSNTPRHAVPARAGLSLGRSQRLMKAKCVALNEFCKRLRRLLIHPVDPIAEDRLRKRQPFLKPIFRGGSRLALDWKLDAARFEDLVGRMNELEGLRNPDIGNRMIATGSSSKGVATRKAASLFTGGGPGAMLAFSAATPPAVKSLRHRRTVSSRTPNASAILGLVQPASVSSTARARSASPRSREPVARRNRRLSRHATHLANRRRQRIAKNLSTG